MPYQAEYIWIDGHQPTPMLRSKTKIIKNGVKVPPIWGFDGSSTEQATFWCCAKYWLQLPASHTRQTLVQHVPRLLRSMQATE
jgi:hypothetical protein